MHWIIILKSIIMKFVQAVSDSQKLVGAALSRKTAYEADMKLAHDAAPQKHAHTTGSHDVHIKESTKALHTQQHHIFFCTRSSTTQSCTRSGATENCTCNRVTTSCE